jgi:hypothetical protein
MTQASATDLSRDHRHQFVVGPHEAGFECDALRFRLGQADGDRQRLGRREGEVTEPQPNIILGRRLNVPARDRLPIRPAAGEQMGHFLLRQRPRGIDAKKVCDQRVHIEHRQGRRPCRDVERVASTKIACQLGRHLRHVPRSLQIFGHGAGGSTRRTRSIGQDHYGICLS